MEKIIEKIKSSQNIIVTAHISEDADAIGSTYAFAKALRNMGKNATVLLSDEPEDKLKFLKSEYIIFKKDMKFDADLVVFLDSADEGRLGDRKILKDKFPNVAIDHHYTNTMYADLSYVDGDASSTGELVYLFLEKMGAKITKPIAEYLYAAISGDTGSFKYSCTSPRTMRIAAELMETGIDHAEISRHIHEQEKIETVQLKGYLMSEIKSFYGGRLRLVTIDKKLFDRFGVSEKNAGEVVNIPRMVEGTEIAVSIRETDEKIKLSFRTNGKYNVSEVAANFGGGGHVAAAGAAVFGADLAEVEKKVIEVVGEILND